MLSIESVSPEEERPLESPSIGPTNLIEQIAKLLREETQRTAHVKKKPAKALKKTEKTSAINTIEQIAQLLRKEINAQSKIRPIKKRTWTKKKSRVVPLKQKKRPIGRRRSQVRV